MAGGCNAHGVSGSAGIGRHVVESIMEKEVSPYVKVLLGLLAFRRLCQQVYHNLIFLFLLSAELAS